ncbi:MAG TPA: hypothetical protein VGB85_06840, partial [Nannocystis sp.]
MKIDLKQFLALAAVMSQGLNAGCTIITDSGDDDGSATNNTAPLTGSGTDTGSSGDATDTDAPTSTSGDDGTGGAPTTGATEATTEATTGATS